MSPGFSAESYPAFALNGLRRETSARCTKDSFQHLSEEERLAYRYLQNCMTWTPKIHKIFISSVSLNAMKYTVEVKEVEENTRINNTRPFNVDIVHTHNYLAEFRPGGRQHRGEVNTTTGQLLPNHNQNTVECNRRPVQYERSADVIAAVLVNPDDSTRRIAREYDISQTTVWRVLNGSKNRRFHRSILCTDQATFKSNGDVNIHNAHYWSQVNHLWVREVDNQHRWSVNVWCGIFGHRIIGPYFFEGALNLLKINCGLFDDARIGRGYISVLGMPEFCPAGVLPHPSKSTHISLLHLNTLKCHRPGPGSNPQPRTQKASAITTTLPGPTTRALIT
ncbi:hypothetical protein ANN_17592 [Periplaneta americana]|uniref:HTH psq-type domain-containing protein n=1 Tax=Periplaneta americana TaxID=6978 RepID=A0ABQ8SUB6_PERAM|nr:hypothetical protein ANN_17592 [Periplaneta americana]